MFSDSDCSNLLNFFADDNGIRLTDLLGSQGVVIERALVLVRVAVKAAKETATSAFESCESDFLSALVASILLRGLLTILITFVR